MAGFQPFRSFFTFSSGVDRHILELCPDGEQKKFRNIGAIVALTSFFAFVSGSYALYTIFDNVYIAIGFGLLWGCMIYALDRYLVASMKKLWLKSPSEMAETDDPNDFFIEDKSREWWQGFPRIVLALVIAVVISKPLEMKIFEKEINQVIAEEKNQLRLEAREQIGQIYGPQNQALEGEINRLRSEIATKTERSQQLYESFITEAEGTAGTGLRGKGPVYADKKAQYDLSVLDLQATQLRNNASIDSLLAIQNGLAGEFEASVAESEPIIEEVDGLMARIAALNTLGGENGHLPSIFIMLLFMAVEMAPILAKLLSGVGHYDKELINFEMHKTLMIGEDMQRRIAYWTEGGTLYPTNDAELRVSEEAATGQITEEMIAEGIGKTEARELLRTALKEEGREYRERMVNEHLKYDIKLFSATYLSKREDELLAVRSETKALKAERAAIKAAEKAELEKQKTIHEAEIAKLEEQQEAQKKKEALRIKHEQDLIKQKERAEIEERELAEQLERERQEREHKAQMKTQAKMKELEMQRIKQEQKAEADLNRLKEKGRLADNEASHSSSNEEDSASAAEETEIV